MIRPIHWTDTEAHKRLAASIGSTPWLWDDRDRAQPILHYVQLYMNPDTVVLDLLDGAGFLCMTDIVPGFRGRIHGAAFDRRAKGRPFVFGLAALSAAQAHDIQYLEAFTSVDNRLARRIMERFGAVHAGTIPKAACYNGNAQDVAWYTLAVETLARKLQEVQDGRVERQRARRGDPAGIPGDPVSVGATAGG